MQPSREELPVTEILHKGRAPSGKKLGARAAGESARRQCVCT